MQITQRELVRHALRFNPNWLIVGEVRDGDAAREMLLAMQHGHPSLSTVHHHSALSAWKKLAQYVAQGSESVDFPIAALLISDAVDFFVHLGRDRGRPSSRRRTVRGGGVERCRGATQPHLRRRCRRQGRTAGPPVRPAGAKLRQHGFDDHLLLEPGRVVVGMTPSPLARRATRGRPRARRHRRRGGVVRALGRPVERCHAVRPAIDHLTSAWLRRDRRRSGVLVDGMDRARWRRWGCWAG